MRAQCLAPDGYPVAVGDPGSMDFLNGVGRCRGQEQVLYDVEPGKLILFESWLRHEVAPNPTRGDRVSVSFNYDWV